MQRIVSACRFGSVQTLRSACVDLDKNSLDTTELLSEFEHFCTNDQFDMAREMISQCLVSSEDLMMCFAFACMQENVATMRFLWLQLEHEPFDIWRDTVFGATHFKRYTRPNAQVIRFLWNNDLCTTQSQQTQLHAIQFACMVHRENTNTNLVQFLLQKADLPAPLLRANHNFLFCCACERGDIALVQMLWFRKYLSHKDQSWFRCAMGHAKFARHTHVVQFLEHQQIAHSQPLPFDEKHNTHAQFLKDLADNFQC